MTSRRKGAGAPRRTWAEREKFWSDRAVQWGEASRRLAAESSFVRMCVRGAMEAAMDAAVHSGVVLECDRKTEYPPDIVAETTATAIALARTSIRIARDSGRCAEDAAVAEGLPSVLAMVRSIDPSTVSCGPHCPCCIAAERREAGRS